MKKYVKSSDNGERLGRWLGANLLTKFTANLNVYGAEESDEYEFEESFDGPLNQCLVKLKEYDRIINRNGLDAYLSLEPWDGGHYFEGDLENILSELLDYGYITEDVYEEYYY